MPVDRGREPLATPRSFRLPPAPPCSRSPLDRSLPALRLVAAATFSRSRAPLNSVARVDSSRTAAGALATCVLPAPPPSTPARRPIPRERAMIAYADCSFACAVAARRRRPGPAARARPRRPRPARSHHRGRLSEHRLPPDSWRRGDRHRLASGTRPSCLPRFGRPGSDGVLRSRASTSHLALLWAGSSCRPLAITAPVRADVDRGVRGRAGAGWSPPRVRPRGSCSACAAASLRQVIGGGAGGAALVRCVLRTGVVDGAATLRRRIPAAISLANCASARSADHARGHAAPPGS